MIITGRGSGVEGRAGGEDDCAEDEAWSGGVVDGVSAEEEDGACDCSEGVALGRTVANSVFVMMTREDDVRAGSVVEGDTSTQPARCFFATSASEVQLPRVPTGTSLRRS